MAADDSLILANLDAEIAAARARIMREVYRRLSHDARSDGQKRRWRIRAEEAELDRLYRDGPYNDEHGKQGGYS